MAYNKDANGKRVITSPEESTSKDVILDYVSTPSTLIKETISKGIATNEPKEKITNKVWKIINESLKSCPTSLKNDLRLSLINMANADFFRLDNNVKVIKDNLQADMKEQGIELDESFSPFQVCFSETFRNKNTDAEKGLPVIADYQQKLRDEMKTMALNPPRVNKNGKVMPSRLLAEVETRYQANQEDISKALNDGGGKLWWTSSHADASPRCEPYQGLLYSMDDPSLCGKTLPDGNHVEKLTLKEVMALNDGNSIINGYNCRHQLIEYVPNSKAPKGFTHEQIKKEYAVDQRQRTYENNIRQLKMQQRLAQQSGDTELARKLSKRWHRLDDKYQLFSFNSHRAFYRWRTQVTNNEEVYTTDWGSKQVERLEKGKK